MPTKAGAGTKDTGKMYKVEKVNYGCENILKL